MNIQVIRQLINEGSWLTAKQIAGPFGYGRIALTDPDRWEREGRIFSVLVSGQKWYAAYQFDLSREPQPVVGQILKVFKYKSDPWKIAAWFASVNGWLGGNRPQDCLEEPMRVLEAARQERNGLDAF